MNAEIHQLQARIAEERRVLSARSAQTAAAFNVPRRITTEVRAHPLKWTAIALAGGLLAARAVPIALGVVRSAASRKLLGKFVTTFTPIALRLGLNKIQSDTRRAAVRRELLSDRE